MNIKEQEQEIVKNATRLALTRYISQFLLAIRGFIIAKVLGPSFYGIWNMFTTTIQLSEHADLGSSQTIIKEVPFNTGQNKEQSNKELLSTAFWWQLSSTLSITLIIFILSFIPFFTDYSFELRLVSIVILLSNTFLFVKSMYLGRNKIKELSWFEFGYAILNTISGIALVFFYQVKGLLVGMIITFSLLLFFAYTKSPERIKFIITRDKIKKILQIGFPILAITLTTQLMQSIDKIIIFILLGSTMTGYYGLASFISLLVLYIPQAISQTIFPHMSKAYGQHKNKKEILVYYTKPMQALTQLIPILLAGIIILIVPVLPLVLSEYVQATQTIQILTASLLFMSIHKIPTNVLILFNKQKQIMKITFMMFIFCGLLDLYLIRYGIEAVALGTLFTLCILTIIINTLALQHLGKSKKEIVVQHIEQYLPAIYITLIVGGSFLLMNVFSFNIYTQSAIQLGILIIASIPILVRLHKQHILQYFTTLQQKKGRKT